MQTYYSVVVIKNGVLEHNYLLVAENNIIVKGCGIGQHIHNVAEKLFLDRCKKYDTTFSELSEEEVDDILNDGYYESHTENIVICLGEPEIY